MLLDLYLIHISLAFDGVFLKADTSRVKFFDQNESNLTVYMSVIKSKNWLSMYDSRALSVRVNQVDAVYSVFLKSPSRCCF